MRDLAEIQAGSARRTGELFETSSGRVWGKHNGSVHPVSGPEVVNVSSPEYKTLVLAQKQGAEKSLHMLGQMAKRDLFTPEQVSRTQNIIHIMGQRKRG